MPEYVATPVPLEVKLLLYFFWYLINYFRIYSILFFIHMVTGKDGRQNICLPRRSLDEKSLRSPALNE